MLRVSPHFDLEDFAGLVKNSSDFALEKLAHVVNVPAEALLEDPIKCLKLLMREDEASRQTLRFALVDSRKSVNGVALVEGSEWDSQLFGVGVGKLRLAYFDGSVDYRSRRLLFRNVKAAASSRGLDVIFGRVGLDDMLTIHSLQAEGAVLTDVLVTFGVDVDRGLAMVKPASGVEVSGANERDEPALVDIAREIFRIDHFHADPRLTRHRSDEVYARWVSSCVKGLADAVLVARKKNQVLGFITCKVEGSNGGLSRGVIDLVGVRKGFEGRGVGACLVGEALKWFSSRTKTVQVGTQAANIGAARLYEKMGFRMVSSEATLHLWVSPT